MTQSQSDKQKAENEVVFRNYNEDVKRQLDSLRAMAKEDGQEDLLTFDTDSELQFYCECSDENCRQRVKLKPSMYDRLHKNRLRFVIVPGHETFGVETIITKHLKYHVVEKTIAIDQTAAVLSPTDVNNN